jgi:GNAT superfamily N-acetyltransferase
MSARPDLVVAPASAVDRAELIDLYEAVGWSAYTASPQRLVDAIAGSSFVVTARHEGRLVGLARAVSDGMSVCYLQDVLVVPDFQRAGVGRALVTAVLDHYADVRQKVLLTDDEPRQRAFYESLGYGLVGSAQFSTLRAFVRFDG